MVTPSFPGQGCQPGPGLKTGVRVWRRLRAEVRVWRRLRTTVRVWSCPLRAVVRGWRHPLRAVVRVWRRLPQPLPDQPPEGSGSGWRAHPLSQGWCLSEALCPELGNGVCTATSEPLEISGQSSSW